MSEYPNFDGIAPLYRWLEYLTLGTSLQQARLCLLDRLPSRRRALVLGDGDGRFTARLLAAQPTLTVDAVDLSAAMLKLLRRRCAAFASRLQTHHCPAQAAPLSGEYDLIATHFFLDCLQQSELDALVARIKRHLAPDALWMISEFRIPPGPLGWPARRYVRALYLAFRLLTGLRTTHLPHHHSALEAAGLRLVAEQRRLFGLLTSELWQTFHTGPDDGHL